MMFIGMSWDIPGQEKNEGKQRTVRGIPGPHWFFRTCIILSLFMWILTCISREKSNSVKEGCRNVKVLAPIGLPRVITPRSSVISHGAGSRTLVYHVQTEPGSWPFLYTLQCYISNSN